MYKVVLCSDRLSARTPVAAPCSNSDRMNSSITAADSSAVGSSSSTSPTYLLAGSALTPQVSLLPTLLAFVPPSANE